MAMSVVLMTTLRTLTVLSHTLDGRDAHPYTDGNDSQANKT